AFFGAQHFSDRLPVGRWLVWDKRRESAQDSHSDCDLVWMTGDSREAMRVHRQKWRGVVREGEENASRSKKLHPNQKPVALMAAIIKRLGLRPGQVVADPFMGSGSTGVAAMRAGLGFIGCEIDKAHFDVASVRLDAEVWGV
ncbi:MAG: DNA methyltransferase, partial [Terriglobales bacterium]